MKTIIYHISSEPGGGAKSSRFYRTMECDAMSPEEVDATGRRRKRDFGSREARLVYKEANSFEDETSPPGIDINTYHQASLSAVKHRGGAPVQDQDVGQDLSGGHTLEDYEAFQEEETDHRGGNQVRRQE